MIYIIDIDSTICKTPYIDGKNCYEDSIPYTNRIKKINDLYRSGHTIIYWTARGTSTGIDWELLTKRQLFDWGVMYHEVRFGKPSYDVWIDDKAFNDKHFFGET